MKQSLHKQNNLESLAAENPANKPGSPIIAWFFLTGLLFLYVACLGKPRTECFPCTSTECGAPLRCTLAAPLPGSYCVPVGSTPLSRSVSHTPDVVFLSILWDAASGPTGYRPVDNSKTPYVVSVMRHVHSVMNSRPHCEGFSSEV